jgi:stearoyl-CoA desaturase (delta-9 desaturase)
VLAIINPVLVGYVFGFAALYSLYASVFIINYLLHIHGTQEHETGDDSKNNWFLNIIALGEGWHNNHHNNSLSYTTQNKWWQFDPTGLFIKYFIATDLKHDDLY